MWRRHETISTAQELEEALKTIKDASSFKEFITRQYRQAYTIRDVTIVVTVVKPERYAARMRAYNNDKETRGENYFFHSTQAYMHAVINEAGKLTRPTTATTTENHQEKPLPQTNNLPDEY